MAKSKCSGPLQVVLWRTLASLQAGYGSPLCKSPLILVISCTVKLAMSDFLLNNTVCFPVAHKEKCTE